MTKFIIICFIDSNYKRLKCFFRASKSAKRLSACLDEGLVLLDLAGDAHVNVLVTDRHNHAANDGGINISCQLDGFLVLDEFLQ